MDQKRSVKLTLKIVIAISLAFTISMLILGEVEIVIAWWFMLLCLLPAVFLALHSKFLSVKIFVFTAFITQAVTMPFFYLNSEGYAFQYHRPFDFTGMAALPVFWRLGLLLIIFSFMAIFIEKLFPFFKHANTLPKQLQSPISLNGIKYKSKGISKATITYGMLIFIVIMIMAPINSWMFGQGIGLTGVEPPRLPYRLSGILTYLAKLVVPVLLSVLYIKTKRRSLLLVVLLGVYSIYLGISTVSRSAALMVIGTPLAFALIDRRWLLLVFALIFGALSMALTTYSREVVYSVYQGWVSAYTILGIIGTLIETFQNLELSQLLMIIPNTIGRFESFLALWLSSQVNPEPFGGGWRILLKVIDWRLADIDHDAVHLEVLGITVPESFFNIPSSVINCAFWAWNDNPLMYSTFTFYYALFLMVQETSIKKIAKKYQILSTFSSALIFISSLNYFIGPGSLVGNYFLFCLLLFAFMPKFKILSWLTKPFRG